MIPVYQTRFGERTSNETKGGNCFQAAVASLFELPLEEVPDFCNIYPIYTCQWYTAYREWLRKRGFSVITLDYEITKDKSAFEDCFLIVSGKNKNGVMHSVIYRNGVLIHNPNPNCTGITPEEFDLIFPLNPAK